nr:RNA-directed DNA polymerase, eukaryota, reverse transcriptase zinc-binding domain protein [Tanacetum cinerariifolium]
MGLLTNVIDNWNGKVVIMGGFNKVRKQVERYGSIFNVQGADACNSFISAAGLEEGNFDVLNKRMYVSKSLQDLDKLESMKVAPKAKIKWVIQGDENSKYYHGILNKKRSRLVIRGIFVDSIWIDYPCLVTSEFLSHFTNHFVQPYMDFPNKLSLEQQVELENNVTREEMKVAVWDCGVDKSHGPDGFTFGFYRRIGAL